MNELHTDGRTDDGPKVSIEFTLIKDLGELKLCVSIACYVYISEVSTMYMMVLGTTYLVFVGVTH